MLQSKPDASDELSWVRSNEGSSRWHSQHASTRHHANHFLSIMSLWANWNPESWNDEGRGAALLPSGSCPVRCVFASGLNGGHLPTNLGGGSASSWRQPCLPADPWVGMFWNSIQSISLQEQDQRPVKTHIACSSHEEPRIQAFYCLWTRVGPCQCVGLGGCLGTSCQPLCTACVPLRAHSLMQQSEMKLLSGKQRLRFAVRTLVCSWFISGLISPLTPCLGGFPFFVNQEINIFDSPGSQKLNRSAPVYGATIEHIQFIGNNQGLVIPLQSGL